LTIELPARRRHEATVADVKCISKWKLSELERERKSSELPEADDRSLTGV
jgi:hypothetical protein